MSQFSTADEEVQHETEVKVTLIVRLKRAIKELQINYLEKDEAIGSNDTTNMLCGIIEASLLHGSKEGALARSFSSLSRYSCDEDPSLNFWGFLKCISHREVISFIESLTQISTSIGYCRAWVRLALSDGSLESYISAAMNLPPGMIRKYYKRTAFMRDPERPGILLSLLQGLNIFRFELPYNSSVLNQWTYIPLVFAGFPVSQKVHMPCDAYQEPVHEAKEAVPVTPITPSAELDVSQYQPISSLTYDPSRITQEDIDDLLSLKFAVRTSQSTSSHASDMSHTDHTDRRQFYEPDKVLEDEVQYKGDKPATKHKGKGKKTRRGSKKSLAVKIHKDGLRSVEEDVMERCSDGSGSTDSLLILDGDNRSVAGTSDTDSISGVKKEVVHGLQKQSEKCSGSRKSTESNEASNFKSNVPNQHIVRTELSEPAPISIYDEGGAAHVTAVAKTTEPGSTCSVQNGKLGPSNQLQESGKQESSSCCDEEAHNGASGGENDSSVQITELSATRTAEEHLLDHEQDLMNWKPKMSFNQEKPSPDLVLSNIDGSTEEVLGAISIGLNNSRRRQSRGNSLVTASSWSEEVPDLETRMNLAYSQPSDNSQGGDDLTVRNHDVPRTSLDDLQYSQNVDGVPTAEEALEALEDYDVLTDQDIAMGEAAMEDVARLFTTIPHQHGVARQNFKCASCDRPIGFFYGKPRVCSVDGLYYCHECHENDEFYIPSRIIHNWDFTKQPVCKKNLVLIQDNQYAPVINLEEVNPNAYEYFKPLQPLKRLRLQLFYLKAYLYTCSPDIKHQLLQLVPSHLLEHLHIYSLHNLLNPHLVQRDFEKAVSFATKHVYTCRLCSVKGFICQLCSNPKIIYPFQVDSTYRCPDCETVYHRQCKTNLVQCPKCKRLKERMMNTGRLGSTAELSEWDYSIVPDLPTVSR